MFGILYMRYTDLCRIFTAKVRTKQIHYFFIFFFVICSYIMVNFEATFKVNRICKVLLLYMLFFFWIKSIWYDLFREVNSSIWNGQPIKKKNVPLWLCFHQPLEIVFQGNERKEEARLIPNDAPLSHVNLVKKKKKHKAPSNSIGGIITKIAIYFGISSNNYQKKKKKKVPFNHFFFFQQSYSRQQ